MADGKGSQWVEILVAVVVSLSALATSWASYQASLWNGVQSRQYSRAGGMRTTATRQAIDAGVTRAAEAGLFVAWLDARHAQRNDLAKYYEARFPPALKSAFQAWMAQDPMNNPDAASSPFALPAYQPRSLLEARALDAAADAAFAEAQRANKTSNGFTRVAVILATAMFLGGIGRVFARAPIRLAMALVALVVCVAGVAMLLTLPMQTLG